MSYMQTAAELGKEVESFMDSIKSVNMNREGELATKLGHIINLAIRCSPRGVQHTVRKNIVAEAVRKYCRVTMTEEVDERSGGTYHKIHIEPRS